MLSGDFGLGTYADNYLNIKDNFSEKIKYMELIIKPDEKDSNNLRFYICELVEMTQNGFC